MPTTAQSPAPPVALLDVLRRIVGAEHVVAEANQMHVYECDGLTVDKAMPGAIVHVHSTEEVSAVLKACAQFDWPFVARGSGTGLSGGAVALERAIVVELARMKKLVELNVDERWALVEAGMINAHLSTQVKAYNLHFAPDPSSQSSCTVGGNVAENSGGPHTLKYGVTVNHILGLEFVTPDGSVHTLGGPYGQAPGYDLIGLLCGSEGNLGIATRMWVKLTPLPEAFKTFKASFDDIAKASKCVSAIVSSGVIPAALEMIDRPIVRAIEAWLQLGLPTEAAAVLVIELDGLSDGLDADGAIVEECCRDCGCLEVESTVDPVQRGLLWKARKMAFGAVGRLSPSFYVQDGVIPPSKLPQVLEQVAQAGRKYNLQTANVFHAGDGNLHPLILFDERDPEEVQRALKCNEEVMLAVIAAGGMLTGEHGIGLEKLKFMPKVFSEDDLDAMRSIRRIFDPQQRANPGKTIPPRDAWNDPQYAPPQIAPARRQY